MVSLLRPGCCTRPVVLPAQPKDERQPRSSTCLCLAGPKLVNAVGSVTCVVIKCGEIVWQGTCNVDAPQPWLRFTLDSARWRPGMHECHVFVRAHDLQPEQQDRPEEGWQHIEETHLLVLPVDAAAEVDALFEGMLADVRQYFQHYSGKQHMLSLLKGLLRRVPFLAALGVGAAPADPLAAADGSEEAYLYTYEHCFVPFLTCWRTAMPEGRLYNEESMYDSVRQLMEYLIEHNMFSCLVLLISRAPALALRALQEGLAHMDSLDVSSCGALRALAQQATTQGPTAAAAAAGGGSGGPEATTTTTALSSPTSSSSEGPGGSSMLADSTTSLESAAELLHMLAELELSHQVAERDQAALQQQLQQQRQQQQEQAALIGAADSQYDPATNTPLFETLEPNPGLFSHQPPAGSAGAQGGPAAAAAAAAGAGPPAPVAAQAELVAPPYQQEREQSQQQQQNQQQLVEQIRQQQQQQQGVFVPPQQHTSRSAGFLHALPPSSSARGLATVLAAAEGAVPHLRGPFTAAAARHVQLVHLQRSARRRRGVGRSSSSSSSSSGGSGSSRWTLRGWVSGAAATAAAAAAGPASTSATMSSSYSERSALEGSSSSSEGEQEGTDPNSRWREGWERLVAEAGGRPGGSATSPRSTHVMHLLRAAAGQLMGSSSSSSGAGGRLSPAAVAATTALEAAAAAHVGAEAAGASCSSKGGTQCTPWSAPAAAGDTDSPCGKWLAAPATKGLAAPGSSISSSSISSSSSSSSGARGGWQRWAGCSQQDMAAAARGFADPHLEQSYAVFKNHTCWALDTTAFIICGGMLLATTLRNFQSGGPEAWGKLQVVALYGALFFFPYLLMLGAATAFLRHREALLAAARAASAAWLIVMAWGWVPQPDAWVIAVSQTYSMQLQNAFILPACQQVRLRYGLLVAGAHLVGDAVMFTMAQPAAMALLTSALVQVTSLLVTLVLDARCRATFLYRYQGPCRAAASAAKGVAAAAAAVVAAKKGL